MSALRTAALGAAGQLSLGSLFVRLTLDAAHFTRGWTQAQATVTTATASMTRAVAGMAAAVAGSMAVVGGLSAREAIRFESSFAGIRKTVNATEEEFKKLEEQMREMGRTMPVNVNEINKVGEWAGQLGIGVDHIKEFTRVMVDMSVTTNMASDEAAKSMARLAKIMEMPHTEFERMGSVIVELGNNVEATETEIVALALRIGGAGKITGMTVDQVLALSSTLSSLGIRAELGGSSISRVIREMYDATFQGGQKLQVFAQTAQMSSAQFTKAFREDAAGAVVEFLEGLRRIHDEKGNVVKVLDDLSLGTVRLSDVLLRSTGAAGAYREEMTLAEKAWKENTALADEAAKRYATLASQLKVTWGLLRDWAITIGNELMPIIRAFNNMLQETLRDTENMNGGFRLFIDSIGPAFIFVVTKIGDIIYGWRLIIKTGEAAFLVFGSLILNTFARVVETIRSSVEGLLNAIIGGVNKAISALNILLPKAREVAEIKLITLDKTEGAKMIEDAAQAVSEALAESRAELDAMVAKGSFSERFSQEYEKVTTVVKKENDKIVEDVEETAKKVVKVVAPLSERIRKAISDLEAAASPQIKEMPALGEDLDPRNSALREFEHPMVEMMNRLSEERTLAEEQLSLLEELGNMELEMTEAVQQKKLEMIEEYNQKIKMLQMAQAQVVFSVSSKMFEDLTAVAEGTAGKQSAIYKTMFAASKAFALADATVKIAQGIAGAAATGATWIDKLAGMAAIAAATSSIVSTIQSVNLEFGGGRATGGPVTPGKFYRVGEEGEELFAPDTAGNIIPNHMLGGGSGKASVKVIINNYTDATATVSQSEQGGEQVIEVMVKRVKSELSSEVRDGRGDFNRALQGTFNLKRGK